MCIILDLMLARSGPLDEKSSPVTVVAQTRCLVRGNAMSASHQAYRHARTPLPTAVSAPGVASALGRWRTSRPWSGGTVDPPPHPEARSMSPFRENGPDLTIQPF